MKQQTKLILAVIVAISLFFNLYKHGMAPPCFNADEAAFSYNAWSILQTGKDEYGDTFPLRLTSYGDYKLPLLTYFTIPFVGVFGLNETAARLPNTLLAIIFPVVIFYLVKELFSKEKDRLALTVAFVVSTNVGIHIVGRHLHEAYLAAFLISLTWLFLLRTIRKTTLLNGVLTCLFMLLSLFTYHSSRIFAGGFLLYALWHFGLKKTTQGKKVLAGIVLVITLFAITDVLISPARVKNLLFFNTPGYVTGIQQMRDEGGSRLFYNKVVPGVKDVFIKNLTYFSPQYWLISGDENYRFGHPGMALITIVEFIFFFVGMYYLFANQEKYRWFIVLFLLITPAAASLAFVGLSLTRTVFLVIPLLTVSVFGFYSLLDAISKNKLQWRLLLIAVITLEAINLFYNWDFYFNHYPNRALVIRSWQCGYKEVGSFIKDNYEKYDKFYISREYGQPYMFLLFFMNYPPADFQGNAIRTPPDQYGFTQVEEFDKFVFGFPAPKAGEKSVYIGLPENDFLSQPQNFPDVSKVKEIKYGIEKIFWIWENPTSAPSAEQ